MSSRAEKERQKAQQEKFQAVLSSLLKDDDNKYCVDCDAKGPRWAAWNLGIFLCIRCAGIHRNLGVHISKVKSVNLDTWTPEQVAMMMEMGNSRARAVYEANLPDNYRRPQTDSSLENFIRAKYETKKYIAKEWIPPKPTIPKELLEDDKDRKKPRPKVTTNLQITAASRSSSAPQFSTLTSKTENKPAATTTVMAEPPVVKPQHISSSTADLIGLDAPSSPQKNNANSLLNDFMGLEHPQPSQNSSSQETNNQVPNGSVETNLFEDTSPSGSEAPKSTKDSILALYGGQQKQQQFNVPGGMYVQQNQNMPGMYQMPQQQQPMMMPQTSQVPVQQPQMYGNQMSSMGMVPGSMGMQQGNMGMVQGTMGMQQGMMGGPGNMGMQQGMRMPQTNMYGQQQQMQQMQYQQMQNQMAGMSLGQPGQMTSGMAQNGIPVGQGWGTPQSGQTLSNNLWQ